METVEKKMCVYEKLAHIQNELKAPKGQFNKFGNYKYRSREDILEAVKPICLKHRTTLVVHDEIERIADRNYLKAICTIFDWDSDSKIEAHAYAREPISKKGMDDSQLTGATSSYARKYALNGLFNIDDTKDADTNELHNQTNANNEKPQKKELDEVAIMKEYSNLVSEMDSLGIEFRGKLNDLILKHANLATQDITKAPLEDIYKLNVVYVALIEKFKKQNGENKNERVQDRIN